MPKVEWSLPGIGGEEEWELVQDGIEFHLGKMDGGNVYRQHECTSEQHRARHTSMLNVRNSITVEKSFIVLLEPTLEMT